MDDSDISVGNVQTISLNLTGMKREMIIKMGECQQRGLMQSYKWLAELNQAIRISPDDSSEVLDINEIKASFIMDVSDMAELDVYLMAKSYFDLKEYDRAVFFTEKQPSLLIRFLNLYSKFLSGEKKRLDDMTDSIMISSESQKLKHLVSLKEEFDRLHMKNGQLDGFCLYLYGVILKKLSLNDEAISALTEAVALEPCHWGAWLELSSLVSDLNEVQKLTLPDHWMKHFFLAYTYQELQLSEMALDIYHGLKNAGLWDSAYIKAQVAIVFHNIREVDRAVKLFQEIGSADPYRLDNLDIYSNLLYVKEERVDLACLAHRVAKIDKYRTETCCVIGNYYSLRSQHEKAVVYFQRALKLNPNFLSAWTLMGHEFIELKNTNAAIKCYRHAIDVNKRDYRAWYGLGQTYEMLKMHFYCLYYYKKAQALRPDDSRMLVALGEAYEKLEKTNESMKCFYKAHCVGDIEGGIALYQLAKLYEKVNDIDQAAAAYYEYISNCDNNGITDRDQQAKAYRFLAQYFLKSGHFDDAYEYAKKCTEYSDTKEEGKAILKDIANRRGHVFGPDLNPNGQLQSVTNTRSSNTVENAEGTFVMEHQNENNEDETEMSLEPMNLTFTP